MTQPETRSAARPPLERDQLHDDPIVQFGRWFAEATAAGLAEPTGMALATADAAGAPSVRIVLLKSFDAEGFAFHTNYESRKGREIEARPRAALALWWPPLHRQIRIEGRVERTDAAHSDAYFQTRAPRSRWSAIASPQSRPIESRDALEERVREARAGQGDDPVRPAYWGGYKVIPDRIEFWQMGADRMHDRFLYTRQERGKWRIERLAP